MCLKCAFQHPFITTFPSHFRATSGDKKNNNKFSPCSLRQINSVLNSKARDSKGCFTEPQKAICGNGVVEIGEECDCGWEEDCDEPCCFPMKNNPKKYQTPCTLRPNKVCSPSQVSHDPANLSGRHTDSR